jgi:tetraprenyl-beta-curcumene synthase
MFEAAKEGFATLATLRTYRAAVLPAARQELRQWRQVAEGISDPGFRHHALSALTDKAANAEATAVLATLAPEETRKSVIRASTALQVAIDYLDTLGEHDVREPLRDGLQLHLALGAAVTPGREPGDWYRHHPRRADDGYLDRLVRACQEAVSALPSWRTIMPFAQRAAERCGEGQSYTHAAGQGDRDGLEAWASAQAVAGFEWWEVAAGASSSVAAHALLALAAEPDATGAEAEAVDAAYFPSIGALTVLLDDLVDRKADQAADQHNYLRYYPSDAVAVQRMATTCECARARSRPLRHARRHRAILAGVVAFYLSSPGSDGPLDAASRRLVLASAGPTARPLAAFLRLGR